MLGDISQVEKIYIRSGYTDMRKQPDGLIDIIQYAFSLILTAIPCSFSAENGRTGSRQSIMKETASAFSISATKTAV